MKRYLTVVVWCGILLGLSDERVANAQCGNNNMGATQLNAAGGTATAPISDTSWNPAGKAYTYSFQGKNIYIVDNTAPNAVKASITNASPGTIQGIPIPVQLQNNGTKTSIFIASTDGYVKRYDWDGTTFASSCATPAPLTRGGVCASDTVSGTPAVMIRAYSTNPSFTALNKDLVYVVTHHGCQGTAQEDSIANQIVAIDAANCTVQWTFNAKGNYPMDYGSEGCTLDYGDAFTTPTLYCGTHLPVAHPQGTLWAIDAVTGALKWAVNADSLLTQPELRGGRLYLGTQNGSLRAHSTTDGSTVWTVALAPSITKNLYAEQRPNGGMNSHILVSDSNGILHGITDNGSAAGLPWTYTPSGYAGGQRVFSAPTVANLSGKVYVGMNNGQLHQLNLLTGSFEHGVTAGASASDSVFDPALDIATLASTGLDRVRVSTSSGGISASNLKTFCIPWVADAAQAGLDVPVPGHDGPDNQPFQVPGGPAHPAIACTTAQPANTACVTYSCDATTGTWKPTVKPDGSACSDGNACTCDSPNLVSIKPLNWQCPAGNNDHCQSGVCVSNRTDSHCAGATSCQTKGQVGVCNNSTFCCGGNSCVDLMNDRTNCGACGNDCSHNRFGPSAPSAVDQCVKGICVRDPSYYCSNSAPDEAILNPRAAQLKGASNLQFPTLGIGANTPCAMAFSFDNTTGAGDCSIGFGPGHNNGIGLVDPQKGYAVQKWQTYSCLFNTHVTPFTNVWPLWDSAYNFAKDWILAGTTANFISGNSPANCGGFLQPYCTSAPLPGNFLVTNELLDGGDIDTNFTTGYPIEGNGPYPTQDYNQGVVGPVIEDSGGFTYSSGIDMYYANWGAANNNIADGALSVVTATCSQSSPVSCTYAIAAAPGWPPTDGSWATCGLFNSHCNHITTITYSNYECRENGNKCLACPASPQPKKIFLTVGTKVYVYYPPACQAAHSALFADISNATWYTPDPTNPAEQAILGFTSASADPLYGDVYFEARDVAGNLEDFVLYVPNTYTQIAFSAKAFYNLGDMAKSLSLKGQQNGVPITVPYNYTTIVPEGRIAAANAAAVRMTVQKDTNPTFTNLPLWP